jgi:hypothetical protein
LTGLAALSLRPIIQITFQDFLDMTRDGSMLDENGSLNMVFISVKVTDRPLLRRQFAISAFTLKLHLSALMFLQDSFVEMMMLQIRDYIGRMMIKQSLLPQNSRTVSSLFCALNYLMMLSLPNHDTTVAASHTGCSPPARAPTIRFENSRGGRRVAP